MHDGKRIGGRRGRAIRWSVIIMLALLIAFILFVAPRLIMPSAAAETLRDVVDAADRHALVDARLKLQIDVRATMLQMLGGVALPAGAYVMYRQLHMNSEGHITERLTKAADQLGGGSLAVRIGGIYALGRIARDSSCDHQPSWRSCRPSCGNVSRHSGF
jgi:hypothetical protein